MGIGLICCNPPAGSDPLRAPLSAATPLIENEACGTCLVDAPAFLSNHGQAWRRIVISRFARSRHLPLIKRTLGRSASEARSRSAESRRGSALRIRVDSRADCCCLRDSAQFRSRVSSRVRVVSCADSYCFRGSAQFRSRVSSRTRSADPRQFCADSRCGRDSSAVQMATTHGILRRVSSWTRPRFSGSPVRTRTASLISRRSRSRVSSRIRKRGEVSRGRA